jgi:four helix bundle protein
MDCIRRIEDLEIWQRARILAIDLFFLTRKGQISKDFSFKNQIMRAAVSVPSNIAEGFERDGKNEFINFLSIAKGSLGELKTQIYLALDFGYISEEQFKGIYAEIAGISAMIGKLMKYLRSSDIKGKKFDTRVSQSDLSGRQ